MSYGVAATKIKYITGRVDIVPGETYFWQEIVAISSVRQLVKLSALNGGITSGCLNDDRSILEFVQAKGNDGLLFVPERVMLTFGGKNPDGGDYISNARSKSPFLHHIWKTMDKNSQTTFRMTFFGLLRNKVLRVPSTARQTDFLSDFTGQNVLVLEGQLTFLNPFKSQAALKPSQNPVFPLIFSEHNDDVYNWLKTEVNTVLCAPIPHEKDYVERGSLGSGCVIAPDKRFSVTSKIGRTVGRQIRCDIPHHSQDVSMTVVKDSGIPSAGKGLYVTEHLDENRVVVSFSFSTISPGDWIAYHENLKWPVDAGFNGSRTKVFFFDASFLPEAPPKWYFINHSCTPNCEVQSDRRTRKIFFVTTGSVKAGTEITFRYTDATSFCTCKRCT